MFISRVNIFILQEVRQTRVEFYQASSTALYFSFLNHTAGRFSEKPDGGQERASAVSRRIWACPKRKWPASLRSGPFVLRLIDLQRYCKCYWTPWLASNSSYVPPKS